MNIQELLIAPDTVVVDVRTEAEFAGGHVKNSVNIPLQQIPAKVEELRALKGAIILCCASGNRSGQAERYLQSMGFNNVHNGGGWLDVNYYKTQVA